MEPTWRVTVSASGGVLMLRFAGEYGERRLQEMREVRHIGARAAHDLGGMRDQAVELAGERLDLGWKIALKTRALPSRMRCSASLTLRSG